jgi:hypothetical protein
MTEKNLKRIYLKHLLALAWGQRENLMIIHKALKNLEQDCNTK